jgi:hypothetical protein
MRPCRALLVAALLVVTLPSSAGATRPPVRLVMGFADDARLGAKTSLSLSLAVDPALPAVTELRLLTPAGLSLSSSRLGAVACRRSAEQFAHVMSQVDVTARCPENSLIGVGTASAWLDLGEGHKLFATGGITLSAGGPVDGKPGLILTAVPYNPVHTVLSYAGYLYVPPAPFEVGLAILIAPIPNPPLGAPVGLHTVDLTLGGWAVRYHRFVGGRRIRYRPGGIPLPGTCPHGGFRFRAILRFADMTRRQVDAVVRCPAGPSRARAILPTGKRS